MYTYIVWKSNDINDTFLEMHKWITKNSTSIYMYICMYVYYILVGTAKE